MGSNPTSTAQIRAFSRFGTIKPGGSLGLAAALAGINPKNLLLIVGAAAAIAQTGISGGQQAAAYAVFAVIASIGVAIPVVIYSPWASVRRTCSPR